MLCPAIKVGPPALMLADSYCLRSRQSVNPSTRDNISRCLPKISPNLVRYGLGLHCSYKSCNNLHVHLNSSSAHPCASIPSLVGSLFWSNSFELRRDKFNSGCGLLSVLVFPLIIIYNLNDYLYEIITWDRQKLYCVVVV